MTEGDKAMFWSVVANENLKIYKRKLCWVEVAFLVLIVLGLLLALFVTIETNRSGLGLPSDERAMLLETITWPGALPNVLRLIGWDGIGPLFLVVLIGAVTAQEYTWRTMQLWLTRGVSRPLMVFSKFAALLLAGMVLVLTAFGAGSAATAIFSVLINGSLHLEMLNFPHLAYSFLRTIYSMLPYGALTFLLAIASRSTVVAISGGLVYTLLFESLIIQGIALIGEPLSRIAPYLPGSLASSLLSPNNATIGMEGATQMSSTSPLFAALGIGIWTLLFLGFSLSIFQRQDLTD